MNFYSSFRNSTFRRQLTLVVAAGVMLLSLLSSLAISWQGSREIRQNRQQQGQQVAASLARQARLALLYESGENAADAVAGTLAFPDVVRVEIRHTDGRPLLINGSEGVSEARVREPPPLALSSDALLEAEDLRSWRFVAAVTVEGAGKESPFEMHETPVQSLGYVRVVLSKTTMNESLLALFGLNMAIAFFFAFVFLFVTRGLARRMTRPLFQLASAMGRAEQGESGVRAELKGPRDIVNMAHAFNSMMKVLDDREQALRQAHDEALRFARLKGDFAATMSHELRTPLNGVVGTLDMLRASPLPPTQRRYVDLAWDSSQYLLDLINNILDFSSLEAGKLALAEGDFDIALLCEQTIELVASPAAHKALEVGYVLAPGVPARLRGDARRLRQVLVNLVGNAVKFTDRGEVAIRVSPVGAFAERGLVRFEVLDTGVGVPPELRHSIFDSFTQADPTSTRRHDGSGLGLAICKQLCGLMGGEIGVDSEPGMGSTFWFTVPLALAQSPSSAAGAPAQAGSRRGRVLLVDESAIVRQFLEQSLTACGYACGVARSVREAASVLESAAAEQAPFQLMIVDTLLAAVDALGIRRLREAPSLGMPRLILMNRYGAESSDTLKADGYLTKPLRLERLLECIAAASGAASQVAAPAGGMPRVLVVEDNRTSQTIAIGMLEMLGCSATLAENGRMAVQAFKRGSWDLILMDCNMPEMDGFAATAAIRALHSEGELRVPIVAMTANTQPSDVEKCLAAGMDDHLPKPLMLGSLASRLRRWLPHMKLLAPAPADMPVGAESVSSDEAVDRAALDRLREALGGAIGRTIRPFLEDMPIYLEALDAAVAAGDCDAQRRAAHAVKGAAGNLGAFALSSLAKDAEELAFAGQSDAAGKLVPRLRAEYALVRRLLARELEEAGDAPLAESESGGGLVLVVDDDRSTRSALRTALEVNGFSVAEANDGSAVLAEVERLRPDVILMDALMPVMDGFAACARLQESAVGRDIPVLMITALDDNASIEKAFAAGASDYIPKPLHLAVVNQRVRRLVDATRNERHVRHLAYNDTLTGLPNRTTFNEHLNRCITRAGPAEQSLALLYLDLDRFKFVNDTLGHETGDKLLKAVAERIRSCVRTSDCVARLGGDEFAVVVDDYPNTGIVSAVAQKICRAVTAPFDIDGHDIVVSASVGIALFPCDGADASTLLRRADTAMYRAKKKNSGFQFFEEGMEASATEHLRLEGALRRALERQELTVFYQPIAEAGSRRTIGMEALVRWRHPARGLVSPVEFIPLAEETGLIVPIGEWVLRTACRQLKAWIDEGMDDLYVTVNLSGLQLQQADFTETLKCALRDTGLAPHHLTLEITESVLMEHAEETLHQLQALKATGVGLAIDDFGTGYSSLSYLRRFPVDVLKIDRAFTRDMVHDADDASIVSGIVALAHNLRLKVVAEGVETEEQSGFLSALHCDLIQGYLLSEPLPHDIFAARHLAGRDIARRRVFR